MSVSAFVLIVFTYTPIMDRQGQTTTRTPSVTMQEFGSEQACTAAKNVIESQLDTRRKGQPAIHSWPQGFALDTICQPKH